METPAPTYNSLVLRIHHQAIPHKCSCCVKQVDFVNARGDESIKINARRSRRKKLECCQLPACDIARIKYLYLYVFFFLIRLVSSPIRLSTNRFSDPSPSLIQALSLDDTYSFCTRCILAFVHPVTAHLNEFRYGDCPVVIPLLCSGKVHTKLIVLVKIKLFRKLRKKKRLHFSSTQTYMKVQVKYEENKKEI